MIGASPLSWRMTVAEREALLALSTKITQSPVVLAGDAVCDALTHLRARRIAVVSPFSEQANSHLPNFFETCGVTVKCVATYGGVQHQAPYDQVYQMGIDLLGKRPGADALYVAGEQWVIAPHIESLERELGLPVVSDTSAMLWHFLRRLHISATVPNHGRLLSTR